MKRAWPERSRPRRFPPPSRPPRLKAQGAGCAPPQDTVPMRQGAGCAPRRADSGCTLTKGVAGQRWCANRMWDGAVVRQMEVVGVRVEMPSNSPIVLLKETQGDRY